MRARATLALHAARASRGPKSLASSRSSELAGDTFFRIVSEHGPGVADLSLTYRPRGACEEYDADGAVAAAIGHGEDDGASTPRVTEINGRKGWRPACLHAFIEGGYTHSYNGCLYRLHVVALDS
jgi:hypothetical protein